jgi:CRP-like cAMP-binding protein
VATPVAELLQGSPLFRALAGADRERLAEVSSSRSYDKGEVIFSEGDPSDHLYAIVSGRVKVVKVLPSGREVILEIFGPGDPLGAVVAYEGRPFPATAVATERVTCLLVRCASFFALMERHPSLVRGFLTGLTQRLVELTRRIPEVAGGRVETRLAHLFLKLANKMGRPGAEGVSIPVALSRQELADLAGTTVETCIRVMSRWGKEGVLRTERDGFLLADRAALEQLTRG